MSVMHKGGVTAPKVEMFQINDVSAYPGIDKYTELDNILSTGTRV